MNKKKIISSISFMLVFVILMLVFMPLTSYATATYSINCVAFNITDSSSAGTVYIETDIGSYDGAAAFGTANENSDVTINAVASEGYEFVEWRKSAPMSSGNTFSTTADYTFSANESVWLYAIFQKIPTTYTVTFDANGGTETMTDVNDISGEYILPECGFTAPEGQCFKAWFVYGEEKAIGDKITISSNTIITAIWEKDEVVNKKGWINEDDKWYYYNENGVMQISKWIGRYYVKQDGTMAVSEFVDDGKYYVDKNGAWVKSTKWIKIDGDWYYLKSGVVQRTKWLLVSGKYYYFDGAGIMQTSKWIGNYYVKSNGIMAVSELVDGGKYYVDENGLWVKETKWMKIGNNWYYINKGTVQISKWAKIGGKYYYFDGAGVMQTSKWIGNYYVKADGSMAVSQWVEGKYYVKVDGTMAKSEWVDNGKYYVGEDGVWVKNP